MNLRIGKGAGAVRVAIEPVHQIIRIVFTLQQQLQIAQEACTIGLRQEVATGSWGEEKYRDLAKAVVKPPIHYGELCKLQEASRNTHSSRSRDHLRHIDANLIRPLARFLKTKNKNKNSMK